jgi:hypothetical protein
VSAPITLAGLPRTRIAPNHGLHCPSPFELVWKPVVLGGALCGHSGVKSWQSPSLTVAGLATRGVTSPSPLDPMVLVISLERCSTRSSVSRRARSSTSGASSPTSQTRNGESQGVTTSHQCHSSYPCVVTQRKEGHATWSGRGCSRLGSGHGSIGLSGSGRGVVYACIVSLRVVLDMHDDIAHDMCTNTSIVCSAHNHPFDMIQMILFLSLARHWALAGFMTTRSHVITLFQLTPQWPFPPLSSSRP